MGDAGRASVDAFFAARGAGGLAPEWAYEYADVDLSAAARDFEEDERGAVARPEYGAEYAFAFCVLRAMAGAEPAEPSQRALRLSERCVALCAGHYSAWHFRRRVLDALGERADWRGELAWVADVASRSAKNYQLWFHRRAVAAKVAESEPAERPDLLALELDATEDTFAETDAKNHHAWAHRQWALGVLGDGAPAWRAELEVTRELIEDDVRNNSAWNHRALAVRMMHCAQPCEGGVAGGGGRLRYDRSAPLPDAVLAEETEVAAAAVRKAPHAETGWCYLRGLYAPIGGRVALGAPGCPARALCLEALGKDANNVHALELLLDCEEARGGATADGWRRLAEVDPMRARYYDHRRRAASC